MSELYILEKLMERLKSVEGLGPDADLPLPCEVFDMICGTSTGGYGSTPCLNHGARRLIAR